MSRDYSTHVLCAGCGVESPVADGVCPICADERQYLPPDGVQRWTSIADEAVNGARIELVEREPGLWGLRQIAGVGIGQQAKILVTPAGGVMVDVPAFIDDAAVAAVREIGGVSHIIASHPHMYGVQSLWAAAFEATVWIAAADEAWLRVRPHRVRVVDGDAVVVPGVHVSTPGGHFPGSLVVHAAGADGAGILLAGDTIFPTPDGWVTFLRSFPNRLPMSAAVVRRVARHVTDRFRFARLYNNFEAVVSADADQVVLRSADRYARWVSGEYDHLT